MSLAKILETETCSVVVAHQAKTGLISARIGEPLKVVALRMAEKQISALPVFDNDDDNLCLGLLDFGDIVTFVLQASDKHHALLGESHSFWDFLSRATISKELLNCSGGNEAKEVDASDSIKKCCTMFAELANVKRLLVKENGKLVGLLSPSALSTHVLAKLKGAMDPILLQTVSNLPCLSTAKVEMVPKTCLLIDAMRLMRDTGNSCVAVVQPNTHVLSGSVSMSDVKLVFAQQDFTLLNMTCWDFIVLSRSLLNTEQFPFFGVGPDSILLNVISKLLATHVHNIYIVDKSQKPIKVIGFPGVCKGLLQLD